MQKIIVGRKKNNHKFVTAQIKTMFKTKILGSSIFFLLFIQKQSFSQLSVEGSDLTGASKPITTAVPFLTITPDSRAGGMGDVGVATSADINSTYWNVGKLATLEKNYGVSLSYTPWLAKLVNDMSISYLTGFYKPTKEQAFGFSMKYFNLGELQATSESGQQIGTIRPKEFLFALSYSRKLSEKLSIGGSGKFILSNLTGSLGSQTTGAPAKSGISGAVDFGIYYKTDLNIGASNNTLALGATITDIGNKMTYSDISQATPIPTALKMGVAFTTELDPYNKITFAGDAFKLMTPSPAYQKIEDFDSISGRTNISYRPVRTNDKPLFSGMFGSFSDASGGFTEEMQEVILSGAVEYWYNDLFAARAGYFHEHRLKGNRRYVTFGFGVKYLDFGLDFAYLVPVGNRNSPLAETLKVTLYYAFESKKPEETIVD
jgi:hypothetical protein